MKKEIDFDALRAEFPVDEVEWRVMRQGTGQKGPWAQVVPYITNRGIQTRLDDVFGPGGWRNEYRETPGGMLCGISAFIDGQWVTKWDGAENGKLTADQEAGKKEHIDLVKTVCTDSMKRAAVQWGIGRYLYYSETAWAVFCDDGEHTTYLNGQTMRWNPGIKSKSSAPAKSEPPAKKEGKDTSANPEREADVKHITEMLLEMAGGEEGQFNSLLRQVSEYTPKTGGESKYVLNMEHLARISDKWLNIVLHRAEELYEKRSGNTQEEPPDDGLPF